ncbi:unnamed protein product [Prorocentrum cordatum]|uniref:Reverse transcriptase domain-containing protein n=1 Tax=Prorocentrum cordatum TaxID=2364126 RepID=A0ABN9W7T4_9DINO|nr:unnamed protein product [Polarella glacialis]
MSKGAEMALAETAADRLGCAIRRLRAVEEGRWTAVQRAATEFPGLPDLHLLEADAPRLATEVVAARRESVADKIRRVKPGSGTKLRALREGDGGVAAEPGEIAEELARHWRGFFTAREVGHERLAARLQESVVQGAAALPTRPASWRVRRQDVEAALEQARPTAPGQDCISAVFWKRLGKLVVDVLHETGAETAGHAFNLGLLRCIPKEAAEIDPVIGQVFTADGMRPLSLVDVAYRIMAGACKSRWEDPLGPWVSSNQRGFFPGRSTPANAVELEHRAMLAALQKPRGMLLLIDFKVAFPSVSRRYPWRCLEDCGMPTEALWVLGALCDNGRCAMSVGGRRCPGSNMSSGIRRGCPLPPLVFATAMDFLLRVLAPRLGPDVAIRAFADDVGIVLTDAEKQLPVLEQSLREFGNLSGMSINLPKTVGIPLWGDSLESAAVAVAGACPAWGRLPLKRAAIYLGCAVGPGKEDLSLETLELCGAEVPRKGPGNWATQDDLWGPREHYGMPRSFGSVAAMARACQMRALCLESSTRGGLQIDGKGLQLQAEWLLSRWLGVYDLQLQENTLVLGALGAYVVYRASNVARAHSGMPAEVASRALQQALREAAAGHRGAERTLAELWA